MQRHSLTFLTHNKIDKKRWDLLVQKSTNSLIFCTSWYLDQFCSWDAIILNDYDGAIALPSRRRFGFSEVYQPSFIQKNVWFGQKTNDLERKVLNLLINKYSLFRFNTNLNLQQNDTIRTNQIIDLSSSLSVREGYSKSLKKNIAKYVDDVEVISNSDVSSTIRLYKQVYGSLNSQITNEQYNKLEEAFRLHNENFEHRVVCFKNERVAGLLFAKYNNRLHYLLGAPNAEGRKLNAVSKAIDRVLSMNDKDYSIFDFEGSSIPNVHSFYASFGAEDESFYETSFEIPILGFLLNTYRRLFKS